MIQILPEERWDELTEIFDEQFDSGLPHRGRATILADIDEDGNIVAFIVVEMLARVGQVWSDKSSPTSTARLMNYIEDSMAPESAVIVIASDERYNSLCEKFQMRQMAGTVYRRDF